MFEERGWRENRIQIRVSSDRRFPLHGILKYRLGPAIRSNSAGIVAARADLGSSFDIYVWLPQTSVPAFHLCVLNTNRGPLIYIDFVFSKIVVRSQIH